MFAPVHEFVYLVPDSANSIFKEMMMDLQLPTTSPLQHLLSIFIGEYIDVVIGSYWLVTGSVQYSVPSRRIFWCDKCPLSKPTFLGLLVKSLVGNFFGKFSKSWQSQSTRSTHVHIHTVRHTSNIKHACPQRKNCNYILHTYYNNITFKLLVT